MNLASLKKEEERKRDAAYDPVARWQHIQQTITWAEANLPPERRRNRPRQPKLHRPAHRALAQPGSPGSQTDQGAR